MKAVSKVDWWPLASAMIVSIVLVYVCASSLLVAYAAWEDAVHCTRWTHGVHNKPVCVEWDNK